MLTVTTAADPLSLLSAEDLRLAIGLESDDNAQDAVLTPMGLRVAADIAMACNVAVGVGGQPTLLQETLTETFRPGGRTWRLLPLSRGFEVEITSITIDGTALEAADYEVDAETGHVTRLSGDHAICWSGTLITAVYVAGFASGELPADLTGVASDLVALRYAERSRDPLLRSERIEIPDVEILDRGYWVGGLGGSGNAGGVPDHLMSRLGRYRRVAVA